MLHISYGDLCIFSVSHYSSVEKAKMDKIKYINGVFKKVRVEAIGWNEEKGITEFKSL